jgi:dTDP-4-amino-4,6-dideoxygalactose transaminase
MINLFKVRMSEKAGEEVSKVLSSGFIGQGSKVEEFEDLLQQELNSSVRPVTVNSCTSAIDLALELIGISAGDEVIATAQTCFASNIGPIHRGAVIRWADIDSITGLISPESVKSLITEKTKAIIAVNWAGKICDYVSLKSFGIPVIEDAAHTWDVFESEYRPLRENRGDYICYSFQAIKYLTSGDGGLLIPPKEKEHQARLLRWFGLDRTQGASFRCTQNIEKAGFKYHMNDINATIGICNLPEARQSVLQQRKNSKYLIDNISNRKIEIPEWDSSCSYWLLSIHADNNKKFIDFLKQNGIESSPVHYRNDEYDCTKQFKKESLIGLDAFSETQICIPNGWWLTKHELDYIIEVLNSYT